MIIELEHSEPASQEWIFLHSIASAIMEREKSIALDSATGQTPTFTGAFDLYVNNGGIQSRVAEQREKELFKREVLPWLNTVNTSLKSLTGRIEMDFAEGVMKTVKLHLK